MKLEIVQATGVGYCPKCGKEIKSDDYIAYVGELVGIEVDECPHCGINLSHIEDADDYYEEEDEDE